MEDTDQPQPFRSQISDESRNPYAPSPTIVPDKDRESKPHTLSIPTEAWRGAKFGARITAIVFGSLVGLLYFAAFSVFVYMAVVTQGRVLRDLTLSEIIKAIGGGIFGVILTSFYGGIAGAIIMALATIVRRRNSKANP